MPQTQITKVNVDNLDLSRISRSSKEALSGDDFIPESSILKSAWGDENGEVELVPMDNGTYVIEQNGIGMGFTDQKGYEYATGDSNQTTSKNWNFDFDKVPIASSAADVEAGNFIDKDRIRQDQWGTDGALIEFIPYGNGIYLIKQDGIAMGFTNQDGYDYLNDVKVADNAETESKNPIEGSSEILDNTLKNIDDRNKKDAKDLDSDIILPIIQDKDTINKYLSNTEPVVDINGEKVILDNDNKLTAELEEKIKNHEGGTFLCSADTDSGTVDYYDYDGVLVLEHDNSISVLDSSLMPVPYIVKKLIDMHIDPSLLSSILDIANKNEASNGNYYNEYMSRYISQNVKDNYEPLYVDFKNLTKELGSKSNGEKFMYNFNGFEIEVHKYEDTFTLDYKRGGHRIIETYNDFNNPELINSRIFTKEGEKYNIYQNGKLISSELQKIDINSYVEDIDKRNANNYNEWYGTTSFQEKYAFVYHHANGNISFKVSNDDRINSIYTYDKNGNLKEKKIEFSNDGTNDFPFDSIDILYGAFDKEISISYKPNSLYKFDNLKYNTTNSDGDELLIYSNGDRTVTVENKKSGVKEIIDVSGGFLSSGGAAQSKDTSESNLKKSNSVDASTESSDVIENIGGLSDTIVGNSAAGLKKVLNNIENKVKTEISESNNKTSQKTVDDLKNDLNYPFSQTGSFNDGNIKHILETQKNNSEGSNENIINKISKSVLETDINMANNLIQNGKRNIEKMEEVIKGSYYKYPNYQKKLERAIDDYNQCDGKIAEVDFFDNGYKFRNLGCGVASIMYIYAMLNDDFDFDPIEFTNDAINQGYFSSAGSSSMNLLNDGDNNILKTKWGLDATSIDSNADSIISALEEGKKVLFNVNINDGFYATGAGHYIVLDHYDSDTNQIYVFDPAARPGFRSTERMGYQDVDFLKEVMFNIPNNPPLAVESSKEEGAE